MENSAFDLRRFFLYGMNGYASNLSLPRLYFLVLEKLNRPNICSQTCVWKRLLNYMLHGFFQINFWLYASVKLVYSAVKRKSVQAFPVALHWVFAS